MKTDIILAGVGGQGILTLSTILGSAALAENLHLKQSEVHGMAQRGGAVVSHLRLSDGKIASDLIPRGRADIIISLETLEALRYLPWLAKEGWLITSRKPVENIPDYPPPEKIYSRLDQLPRKLLVNAQQIATDHKLRPGANTATLGAATPFIGLPRAAIRSAITSHFADKKDGIQAKNLEIFEAGLKLAENVS